MAKKKAPIDPLVASLMPESDKKMGAIAGISFLPVGFHVRSCG